MELSGEVMLAASIGALFVGPLIQRLADRESHAYSLVDGFVIISVLGLALLEIIPGGFRQAGWMAIAAVGAGVLLPIVAERRFGGHSTHRAAAWAAFVGMALHAVTDGLAVVSSVDHGHALGWAVILHRIPVGFAIWWMLTSPGERGGQRTGVIAIATIAIATIVGYMLGSATTLFDDSTLLGVFTAFVGGLLVHVVSHGIGNNRSKRAAAHPIATGIGGLLALAVVLGLFVIPAAGHEGHSAEVLDVFWALLLESAPALVIAYGIAGLLGSVMGEAPARWLRKGSVPVQALRGVAFGLPLPLCSCGVVPVYRSLIMRKVPAAAALAFLVATPEIGLDAILLSFPLLGLDMAVLRVGVSFLLALTVGVVVGGWIAGPTKTHEHEHAHGHEHAHAAPKKPLKERLLEGLRTGYGEILDSTGPWIVVGLLIAAVLQPWIDTEGMTALHPAVQVIAFGLVGLPVYVCATGATPLVAVLIAKGLSPGAALAFLLTGPATNATTFGVLEQLHGRKIAIAFTLTVIVSVLALGFGVNAIWPNAGAAASSVHVHDEHGLIAHASAVLLGAMFVLSLLRQGPRGFLGRLWELGSHGGHDHDHDHDTITITTMVMITITITPPSSRLRRAAGAAATATTRRTDGVVARAGCEPVHCSA